MTQFAGTLALVPPVASAFYSDSKFGAMNNGDKKPYLILELLTGQQKEIHPRKVAQLLTGKEVDGFKVVDTAQQQCAEQCVVEQPVEQCEQQQCEQKQLSKKARAIAIYNEVHAANGARKDAMIRFKAELGMSDAGANTYYQNIKSGQWA